MFLEKDRVKIDDDFWNSLSWAMKPRLTLEKNRSEA